MVPAQLFRRDVLLLGGVVGGLEDVVAQPLVAAGRREHAPHEVPAPVGMGEGVEGVVGIHPEPLGGDEQGAGGAQGDVAAPLPHHAGAHGGGGVVAGAGHHLHVVGEAQGAGQLGPDGAHHLVALEEPGHLLRLHAADVQHLGAPGLVLHVQEEHAGGVGVVAAVDAGEDIVDVVLGEHDLGDLRKVLRFVFPHPQQLGGGEAGEGDVGGEGRELLLPHLVIEIVHLGGGAAVVPQNGGADDPVPVVQHHQAVHLAAAADAGHLTGVKAGEEGGDALQHRLFPVLRGLLAPAGLGKLQRILPGHLIADAAVLVHQQQLDGGGAQVDTDVIHKYGSFTGTRCAWR